MIPWDKPKVYAYYAQQGWSKDDVDFNIFEVYSEDSTNHTAFDPTSIMEYADPGLADDRVVRDRLEHRAIGDSTVDFMRQQYPKGSPGTVELDRRRAAGRWPTWRRAARSTPTISTVGTAATHIMTTEGPSDTVLTLHGPNDPGAVLAWDDDRGRGERPHRAQAVAGRVLAVRAPQGHRRPGTYTVGVKSRR